jgi:hypothetical protein
MQRWSSWCRLDILSRKKRIFSCLGDPNDKTLRKVELEVCIPGIIRERSHREKCPHLVDGKRKRNVLNFNFIWI